MKEILHIYKRVSSSIQVDGTSLKTQEEIGIKLANQLGMDYRIHDEGGKSSAKEDLTNRPVMLNLLMLMDKGVVKHLYVYNTDRLSRNQSTWFIIRQKMINNKVVLYTPKGVHSTEDSMENMILGILSEISQYDNKIRTERSRLGKFEKVKMNFWRGGHPPYGYEIVKGEGGSRLQINPAESKCVQLIFNEYVKTTPIKHIKQILENSNIKTRRGNKHWSLGTLQSMLRNDLYIGVDTFYDKKNKQTIINKVPAIIAEKLFELAKERRLKILQRKGQLNRTTKFYLLRDFMVCKSCGTPIGGRIRESKGEYYYYCPLAERKFNKARPNTKPCEMKHLMKISATDNEVWNVITKIITNSKVIKDCFTSSTILGSGLSDLEIIK